MYKLYLGIPIHLFSHNSSSLILNFMRYYSKYSIYDPKEILYGIIRFLSIRDYFDNSIRMKVRTILSSIRQKLTIKHVQNMICRDMQLSNPRVLFPKKRRTKNLILFADYLNFPVKSQVLNTTNKKIKLACCGNLNVYDYKRSESSFMVFEEFLKQGHEVHIYTTFLYENKIDQFYDDHPKIKQLKKIFPLLKVHSNKPLEELHLELNKCDYGTFLPGEHFFNSYGKSNSFWKPEYVFLSAGARLTSYIESGIVSIVVGTKPQNYPFFLAKRYGKVLSINYKQLHKLKKLLPKHEYPENNRNQNYFKLEHNIPRLENFYEKVFNNIQNIK